VSSAGFAAGGLGLAARIVVPEGVAALLGYQPRAGPYWLA
jgi:hypothetical protein